MFRYPNLFIIGAMKAGTSSLHEYLHQHPQIFMSRMKEPQYFAPHVTRQGLQWGQGQPHPEPGIGWYLRLFADAGDAKYAGESSVSYTAAPWVTDCEKRIYEFNPQARFVYLVRDPVERAVSHYWHFVADGREDRSMLAAMKFKEEYVSRSDYLRQVMPYWNRFGRDAVHIMLLEDLVANPAETLRALFQWLGVNANVAIDTRTRHNVGASELWQTRRGLVGLDTLGKNWRIRALAERCPAVVRTLARRLVYRRVDRAAQDARQAIEFLRSRLQPAALRLGDALSCDFPQWVTLWDSSPTDSDAEESKLVARSH